MQKTVPTIQIHSKDEYNIVALFSEQSIKMIISFQEKLKTKLGDVIWLTPASILHTTLMEVIWDTDYQNKTRHEYFLEWYDKYNQTTKDIINSFSPFQIIFNQLEVSPNAIIIKSSNPKKLMLLEITCCKKLAYLKAPDYHLVLLTVLLLDSTSKLICD